MSCWHGGHGCGPWYRGSYDYGAYDRGPHDRGWCDPGDRFDEADWPMQRLYRRPRQLVPDMAAADLEAHLEQLHRVIRQIETELITLHRATEPSAGT